jgi:histone deacetylase 1/2
MKGFGVPMILIGGGGYTLRNVPRCWTYETSVAIGKEIDNEIPDFPYRSYFSPDYKIHMPVSNMENNNSKERVEQITKQILDNLKHVSAVNVDHSSYRNRLGHPPPHCGFDE